MMESWGDWKQSPCFFMDLNLVKIALNCFSEVIPALIPLVSGKGSAFEDALRQIACLKKNSTCGNCSERQTCSVASLVARELSRDLDLVRRHQKPSLPYVFQAIHDAGEDSFKLGVVLLGPATTQVPLFLKALDQLVGQPCCRSLVSFDYQHYPGILQVKNHEIEGNLPVLAVNDLIALYRHHFSSCCRIRLDLKSSLRLVRDGRELHRFEPVFFIRSLLRRLSAMAAYYGGGVDHEFFRYLAKLSEEVHLSKILPDQDVFHKTAREITGSYEISGPFEELGPLLVVGGMLHVGKGAAYGKGAFEVTPIS